MSAHVMLDLETMSSNSNASIASIGACKFSVEKGIEDTFYINVKLSSCIASGLHVDGNTIMWWMQQSDAARNALNPDQFDLTYALDAFTSWFNGSTYLWGNGAPFDNVVLSNAYKAVGFEQPWSFRNDSCYRTIKNMVPAVLLPERKGTHHNALDDAVYQAEHLIKIFKHLGI